MDKELRSMQEDKTELSTCSRWKEIPTLKEGPSERVGHCCLFVSKSNTVKNENSGIYIVGGADPSQSYSDAHILDLDQFSWSSLVIGPFHSRYEHSLFMSETLPNKIFIFGGADEDGNKNDIQCLDVSEYKWRDVSPSGEPPAPRTYHNGVCVGDKFFVFGGGGLGSSAVDDEEVHIYDITNKCWLTPKTAGSHPSKRLGHAMVTVGNKVYLHGGMNEIEMYDDMYVFDMETYTWTCLEVKGDKPSSRTSHGGVSHGNHIFIMGGLQDGVTSDEMFQFDIETMTWRKRDDLKMPRAALDFAVCCFKGTPGSKSADTKIIPIEAENTADSKTLDASDLKERVYAFIHGGMNHTGDVFGDCFILPLFVPE